MLCPRPCERSICAILWWVRLFNSSIYYSESKLSKFGSNLYYKIFKLIKEKLSKIVNSILKIFDLFSWCIFMNCIIYYYSKLPKLGWIRLNIWAKRIFIGERKSRHLLLTSYGDPMSSVKWRFSVTFVGADFRRQFH